MGSARPGTFERFVTLRYLRSAQGQEEGRGFLRFILYVAVGGVAVGVAALLLALSIVRGFSQEIADKIIGIGAHIQVESIQDAPLQNADTIGQRLTQFQHVEAVEPVVQEFVLLRRSAREIDGVAITGVETFPAYLADRVTSGRADLSSDGGLGRIAVGKTLQERLGLAVDDTVTVFQFGEV